MAVKRSQNWINQQRVDVPHLRSIESAVRNDFDELFTALITGEDKSYVIRGMEIEMAGSIGASANGLQLIVADSSILHGNSNESGTFFNIPSGTANQVLSATTNLKVDGAFTPAALNYVSIEFTRQVDDSTTSQLYLWNPTTKNEITKTLPLAEVFDYKIVISSSIYTANVLPIAIVETDSSNNVLSVQDRRDNLFSTATGGSTTPNPFNEFDWAEGRTPNFWESSSSSVSPFQGGDKQITTFKENDLAIKTEIKLMKGTQYWSSPNIGGSIAGLRYDLGNTILTGRGSISHDDANAGLINWDEDIFLTVLSTRLKYKLESNAATTDVDLDDKQVAYIKIVRNEDVIPQLIFTNGSPVITSVGAISWTTELEAGDFVKVAAEEDFAYYQILSIDSASQVTLTENFGGTSTGINGTDAKYAWGNYRTDAAPSTDRHIKVANLEDMPFNADTFWLFFRDDNSGISRIYVRFLNAELKQGETITISDQVPAAVLAYMGSASDVDADPDYNTLATGTKTGTENYNSTQGENLTVRNSKLTSMMADKAQDKTIELVSDHTTVVNTTNVAAQEISFSGGTGIATVIMPSSANNGTIGTGGILSLNVNQAAYYQVDRNAVFNLADLTALTVVDIDSVPHDENTFVFAYRLASTTVFLWNGQPLELGTGISLGVLTNNVRQNKNVKMVKGGTWSWDLVTTILKNSAPSFIQVAGLADDVNRILAQDIVLPTDGDCAYITLKRTAGASTRTVTVAAIASVPNDDDSFIIARRLGDEVIVGTGSFLLKTKEFLELDGALAEINRYHSQLRVSPTPTVSKRVNLAGSDFAALSGTNYSLEQKNLLLDFDGVQIDFSTGEIFETDGLTSFLGGASDFTPFTIGANEYFYYSVSLLPNTVNADNTISAQMLILPAATSNAVLATAAKAPFPSSGIKIANVFVQEDGAGDILVVDYANITQLSVGGSGSGSGDANELLERLKNRVDLVDYDVVNTAIFASSEEDLTDPSSTASYDITNASYNFELVGEKFVSIQMLDALYLSEEKDVQDVELVSYWDIDQFDPLATYEVSRDGGNEYQTITTERIGNSDTVFGRHVFAEESTFSEVTEHAVTDALAAMTDTVTRRSQAFTIAAQQTLKKLFVRGNVTGFATMEGKLTVQIVKDNAGVPSTASADIVFESVGQDLSSFVADGNIDIELGITAALPIGTYHIVYKTDLEYRSNWASGITEFALRADSADAVPSKEYAGSWGASAAGQLMYRLEGRLLDLRVRITSATADVNLFGFGIFYDIDEANAIISEGYDREVHTFSGDLDKVSFPIVGFTPDKILLCAYELGTGQVYRKGAFTINGTTVEFSAGTFDKPGEEISLEFLQVFSGSMQFDARNRQLLAENNLGSQDPSLDLSSAGRGIILQRPDGTMRELTINDDDLIAIKTVP